jgi:hypothetical protein
VCMFRDNDFHSWHEGRNRRASCSKSKGKSSVSPFVGPPVRYAVGNTVDRILSDKDFTNLQFGIVSALLSLENQGLLASVSFTSNNSLHISICISRFVLEDGARSKLQFRR